MADKRRAPRVTWRGALRDARRRFVEAYDSRPAVRLAVRGAVLAVWTYFMPGNWAGLKRHFLELVELAKTPGFDKDPILGISSIALLCGHLIAVKPVHDFMLLRERKMPALPRRLLAAAVWVAAFTALAPGSWLLALGPCVDALLLFVGGWLIGQLYLELGIGLLSSVGALFTPAMYLGLMCLPALAALVQIGWNPQELLSNLPGIALSVVFVGPLILLVGIPAACTPLAGVYGLSLGIFFYGVSPVAARDGVFGLYRSMFLLTFPVYALGLSITDRRTLKKFVLWNLPFILGVEEEAAGGVSGGAGASGAY